MGLESTSTDTYFVVAHFLTLWWVARSLGYLAGIHFWWPRCRRHVSGDASKISAWLVFSDLTQPFFPQFILGYMGCLGGIHLPARFQGSNVRSSAGASILGLGSAAGDVLNESREIPASRLDRDPW